MSEIDNTKQNRKIFIIEDDILLIRLYEKIFRFSNYETEFAVDGEEAIAKLETAKQKPALIILDIMIPKISGFDVLKQIKEKETLKNIPVVILTNLVEKGDQEKVLGLGASLYLIKSQNEPKEIVRKIKEILDRTNN